MEYTKEAHYFSFGATHGTNHLVKEERETEVVTACGRTLKKKGPMSLSRSSGAYVSPISEQPGDNTCGNCPWDKIE